MPWRPFQRMDPARRAPGGLGLGLAIVSAVAAGHGADLHAVARSAGGLAVEILFPAPLDRGVVQLAGADPDHAVQRRDPDLAIANRP